MSNFYGRNEEIAAFTDLFDRVKNNNPHFLTLFGDTGLGKTRLIQEFYHHLNKIDDDNEYWPNHLRDTENTMSLVPDFTELYSSRSNLMPWMWVALRCPNENERNSTSNSGEALNQARNQIRLHLHGLFEAKKRTASNIELAKSALSMISSYAFPGGGPLIVQTVGEIFGQANQSVDTFDAIKNLFNSWNMKKRDPDYVNVLAQQNYTSLVEQSLEAFESIFNSHDKRLPTIPLVLIVDDAQWMDPLTYEFINQLFENAIINSWPLFIIVTCWESSFKLQNEAFNSRNGLDERKLAKLLNKYSSVIQNENTSVINLLPLEESHLFNIIDSKLPTLTLEMKKELVDHCSGDIELLIDHLSTLKSRPGFFTPSGELFSPSTPLNLKSSNKKEIARKNIEDLGIELSILIMVGSAQGMQFSKSFIEQCEDLLKDNSFTFVNFNRSEDPYNLTQLSPHLLFDQVAKFKRRLYYEIARDWLEDFPLKQKIINILKQFYKETIVSPEFIKFEQNDRVWVIEEYLSLAMKDSELSVLDVKELAQLSIQLLEHYLVLGDFDRCYKIGEDIIKYHKKLSGEEFNQILSGLVEASYGEGDISKEEQYINDWKKHKSSEYANYPYYYYYQSKYQLRTNNAKKALESAQKATSLCSQTDIEFRFNIRLQEVVSNFYSGDSINGLKLISEIENEYSNLLKTNEHLNIRLNHTLYLLFHNLDMNIQSIERCLFSKEGYLKINDYYNYLISCVNLSDSYLASGSYDSAYAEIKLAYDLSKQSSWKHAQNIAAICYGNVLLQSGRLSEALNYYEEGIFLSEEIQHYWDMLYGQIWRALALSEFGDTSSFAKLLSYIEESRTRGYDYLVSLGSCFALQCAANLGARLTISSTQIKDLASNITASEPGLKVSSLASVSVIEPKLINDTEINEFLNYIQECEGLHGNPIYVESFFKIFIERNPKYLSQTKQVQLWIQKYVEPIKTYTEKKQIEFKQDFSPIPKLSFHCSSCEAFCCYDGVYVSHEEEENIKEFVEGHKEKFHQLPKELIVDGNWNSVMEGRKTATTSHSYERNDYPVHFEATRCIFVAKNNECSLQRVATDLGYHPWKIKPKACWMFPLNYSDDNKILPPPTTKEKDELNLGDHYPGYISHLPCGKENSEGIEWYTLLKQEILFERSSSELKKDN
ncbi:ATP-binding protein [Exiguobacterium sp. s142]|uniref:tetratricopeptide repeat protein n=1 Tax=Exiguobacterium sp. s142 TaxID=2751222 RepID=UPI001BEC62FD|nr:ATP-binding protein [Exiguobacterium sp. s142]